MVRVALRERLVSAVAALAGMFALPACCLYLRYIGPASRVVWFDYLPVEELAITVAAAVIGASLGVLVPRSFSRSPQRRLPILRLTVLGLLLGWIGLVQLRAFPASASAEERAAWAHARIPAYAALTRVIASLPEVRRDLGHVTTIAPTALDEHRSAREMNGDDMRFVLDVSGERGRGVFHVECTLDDYRVYHWGSGRWLFNGRDQHITQVSERVPGK